MHAARAIYVFFLYAANDLNSTTSLICMYYMIRFDIFEYWWTCLLKMIKGDNNDLMSRQKTLLLLRSFLCLGDVTSFHTLQRSKNFACCSGYDHILDELNLFVERWRQLEKSKIRLLDRKCECEYYQILPRCLNWIIDMASVHIQSLIDYKKSSGNPLLHSEMVAGSQLTWFEVFCIRIE